ncbi:hypothetical protein [Nocardia sp. NPDC056000]|uniref:hypothetical protein n=1 Tax=Nocardia sp. NPDC056000 TaxID=3345674 RepID=UPI0035DD3353
MAAATVYTCRVTNWRMLGLSLSLVAIQTFNFATFYQGRVIDHVLVVVLFLSFVKAVMESNQRISAGLAGLTVNLGWFGLPRISLARANIVHVEIMHRWGDQHGASWSRKRGWSLSPRSGPILRVYLISGRRIAVAVNDPVAALTAMQIPQYAIAQIPYHRMGKRVNDTIFGVGVTAPQCPRCEQPWGRFAPGRTRTVTDRPIYICAACTIDETTRTATGYAPIEPDGWPVRVRTDPRILLDRPA